MKLIIVSLILFSFFNCGQTNKSKNETAASFQISDFNFSTIFDKAKINSAKALQEYQFRTYRLSGMDTATYNANERTLTFLRRSNKDKNWSATNTFYQIPLSTKDSASIPRQVEGFQLIGAFENEEIKGTLTYLYYVNPNISNTYFQVMHLNKIGNVLSVYIFTKDSIPSSLEFKKVAGELLSMDRPFSNIDTVNFKIGN